VKRRISHSRPVTLRPHLEPLEDRCNPDGSFGPWGTPTNLGAVVNTASSDAHPAISKDGLSLYITTNRPENADDLALDDNIWVSQRASENDPWGAPVELGPAVNTTANDRVPTFSRDGHWMFFGSNRAGGTGGLDVWASYRQDVHDDFAWQPAMNLGAGVNSTSDDDGPTYFQNEETGVVTLYFTSARPGGLGNFDIYATTQNPDGSFGPAALVPELSSAGRDTRTAIRHDGREMFITSNRAGSAVNPVTNQPSLDLWVSIRASTGDPWGAPVNLGATVNSPSDDGAPAISSNSQTLYFYSNRDGGFGGNDLYVTIREKDSGGGSGGGSLGAVLPRGGAAGGGQAAGVRTQPGLFIAPSAIPAPGRSVVIVASLPLAEAAAPTSGDLPLVAPRVMTAPATVGFLEGLTPRADELVQNGPFGDLWSVGLPVEV
jgi:WD40 repeat protein